VRGQTPPGGTCQKGGILAILRGGGYRPPDEILNEKKVGEESKLAKNERKVGG